MVRIFRGGVLDERFEGSVVVIGPRPTTMTGLVRGDLEIYGMVQGDVINEGGRLFVDKGAVVRGKVIGQTHNGPIPPPEKVVAAPAAPPVAVPTPATKPPAPPTP